MSLFEPSVSPVDPSTTTRVKVPYIVPNMHMPTGKAKSVGR